MEAGAWGAGANRANGGCHVQLTTRYPPRRSFCPRSRKARRAGVYGLPLGALPTPTEPTSTVGVARAFRQAALDGPGEPTRDRPLLQEVTGRPRGSFCGRHTLGAA